MTTFSSPSSKAEESRSQSGFWNGEQGIFSLFGTFKKILLLQKDDHFL